MSYFIYYFLELTTTMHDGITFAFFLIFFGASVLATLALYTRQSMLVAYIILGLLVGPYGLGFIPESQTIEEISNVGIMFLLFLLGLNLQPKSLIKMLHGALQVTIISSVVFAAVAVLVLKLFHMGWIDALIIGISMMFSSTIIGLKLLPTTALHHQHIGKVVVSVLLLQDVVAILVLLVLNLWKPGSGHFDFWMVLKTLIAMPILITLAYYAERFLLHHLLRKFDRIKEYIFLVPIGWCLALAEVAGTFGLSQEIGAFIAGVSLAASPISRYIAENLKPLRDFFLIVFFFSVGASFDFRLLPEVFWPVLSLAIVMIILKPIVYRFLHRNIDENKHTGWEIGMRLGQASEFSLLVGFLAFNSKLITEEAYLIIEAVSILTFIVSSYAVVMRYPSPIAFNSKLRRD